MKNSILQKYTPPLFRAFARLRFTLRDSYSCRLACGSAWRFITVITLLSSLKLSSFAVRLLLSLTMLFAVQSGHAAVSASVAQDVVYEGDPVTLVVESSRNDAKPDLSPLQRDFTILGASTSSQINIINGKRSFKKTWTIELQPKKLGKLEIPALKVGSDISNKITVNVTKLPPEVKAETSKHVIIETSIDGEDNGQIKETYVQQQIPYTIKLFYDSAMISGEINPQNIENAVIEQLGNDRHYKVVKGGQKFNVVEKRFVISPEKSGTLIIPPTIVTGRIALSNGDSPQLRRRMDDTDMLNNFFNDFRNDPFFGDNLFSRGPGIGPSKPFTLQSKEIKVNVLPVPAEFTGKAWLPAEELVMQDSWSNNPPSLKVGEPVSRTLVLQAKGLAGSQIPEIDIPRPDGIKVYPEPAESETRTDGKTVYGIQQQKISYIPNKSGTITIPALKIDWWNVKTKKQETFTLPKLVLNVAPGVAGEESQEPPAANTLEKTNKLDVNNVASDDSSSASASNWKWMVLSLVALVTLAFLLYRYARPLLSRASHQGKEIDKGTDVQSVKNKLLEACKKNDKHSAAQLLIQLAQLLWGDTSVQNLNVLSKRLNHGSEIVNELEQSLYSPASISWDGEKLYQLVSNGIQQKEVKPQKSDNETLKPLYPF